MLFPIRNFKILVLLNALFKNSEKLINVKALTPFHIQKILMFLTNLFFEKNGIIFLIRYHNMYHIKGGVVINLGMLS
jgi:hypothetical protein